ncbi:MAG: MFS transporter [Rhizobiaceae bacterium]
MNRIISRIALSQPASQHVDQPCNRKSVLAAAILASSMGFIDFSVIAVALPQIRSDLGAGFSQAQWVSNSYMLFLSALILLGGALGDRLGIKTVFTWGIVIFTVSSLACAIAWDAESLIGFRALQGIGAAIMIPGSMALISINTPRAERGGALGIWVSATAISTSLGPLLAGVLLTYGGEAGWRWIFAINLPLGILTLLVLKGRVPTDSPVQPGILASIDWLGAILLTFALALLAVGLTLLGETRGTQAAMLTLGAGCATGLTAILWELRQSDPIVDLRLFRFAAFASANALTFLVWAAIGALVFYLPMLMIVAWKLPAIYAGGMFVPFSIMIAALSPISGRLADRLGLRLFLVSGPLLVAAGNMVMAYGIYRQAFWSGVLPATFLIGIGVGFTASPLSTAVMNAVDDTHSGAASGINNMMARMANLFGVAGLGALISWVYALVIRAGDVGHEIQILMIEAGFGERLTGPLYQVKTETLQLAAMNHAAIALCLCTAALSSIGAVMGWFGQSSG